MKKAIGLFIPLFLLSACAPNDLETSKYIYYGDIMNSFLPEVGEAKLLFKHSEEETCGDDGEDCFYNYCPSIFIENNVEHVYYCTNKVWLNVTDHIGYRSGKVINNQLKFSEESLVISPTADTWDSRHTCDPSVVKGNFKYNGEQYSYLMAFLGCIPEDCNLNETGLAVAKTPEGPWIKCNGFKSDGVTPINPIVKYSEFGVSNSNRRWGTGQPCLLSVDKGGKVILFTTIGNGSSFMNVREYDFSDINNYVLLREAQSVFTDGVVGDSKRINNAEFCYDQFKKRIYMDKGRSPFGKDGLTPNFIADTVDLYGVDVSSYQNPFDIFFDKNRSQRWNLIGSVDSTLSGYPRNHNCGLVTDEYGHMYKEGKIGVSFSTSMTSESLSAMSYLKTYRIFVTTFNVD